MKLRFTIAIAAALSGLGAAPTTVPIDRVLTPPSSPAPRINGPAVFGVRPGSPLLYSVPVTGDRPMKFLADGLPGGVAIDPTTGRLTGRVDTAGNYAVVLHASNNSGSAARAFRIIVGDEIGLTPAMGWNSYNCFGERVTQALATRAAHRLVELGLDRHGWTYVNMDDGWQGSARDPTTHALQPDPQRFPDIRAMVDEIHGLGLKAGLYSTPWTVSYGGRLGGSSQRVDGNWDASVNTKAKKNAKVLPFAIGPYRFTAADAKQFADWGFDYLKYDWGPVELPETKEMHDALRATGRDVMFSLSNNHIRNLFPLIGEVSPFAQSWRTTTDIRDVWSRVANDIGFAQGPWAPFTRPGHFNDADMLVVGYVGGWSSRTLHPSHLTPDEQFTHLSLWCLLASPLLIGTDLELMDPFTLGLLSNDEVLDVDQDALGRAATQVGGAGNAKVYAKPMADGSLAVGLFNVGPATTTVAAAWSDLKLTGRQRVRDLWRQRDITTADTVFSCDVPSHGVVLVRMFPSP